LQLFKHLGAQSAGRTGTRRDVLHSNEEARVLVLKVKQFRDVLLRSRSKIEVIWISGFEEALTSLAMQSERSEGSRLGQGEGSSG